MQTGKEKLLAILQKTKAVTVYITEYAVYLVNLAYWFVHRQISKYPKKLVIPVTGVLGLLVIGLIFSPFIKKYLNTPRPLRLSKAPTSSGYDFVARDSKNKFEGFIGDSKTNTPKVEVNFGTETKVDFTMTALNGNISEPDKSGNKVTFKDVRKNVDLSYQTLPNGIEELIIIKEVTPGNAFTFNVNAKGANPRQIAPNTYAPVFYDTTGKYVFHFAPPFAFDAKGARTDSVVLGIHKGEGEEKYTAAVIVDKKWLEDPARVYPITIDPTVTYNTTSQFANGTFNHVKDTGTEEAPNLETYYQELPTDQYTVGLWHFNEASGNALDSSGNANTGTPTGTTIVSGLLNNARSFNRTDYIKTASTTSWNFGTGPFTEEFWINFSANTDNQYITDIGSNGALVRWYSGAWRVESSAGTVILSYTHTPTLNTWYHFAVTRGEGLMNLYLNGNLVASGVSTGSFGSTAVLTIGDYGGTGSYGIQGMLDELRISKIARTPEEIKTSASRRPYSVYTSDVIDLSNTSSWSPFLWTELGVNTGDGETLKDATSLVAQWNLNEISGTTATNNAGSCGATCNGTLTNFASTGSQDAAASTGWTSANRRWGAGALMFDGTNDTVNVGSDASIDNITAKTFCTWINLRSQVGSDATGSHIANKGNVWFIATDPTNSRNIFGQNFSTTIGRWSFPLMTVGSWNYLCVAYDRSSVSNNPIIYVNGITQPVTEYSTPVGSASDDSASSLYLGSSLVNNRWLAGTLDSTRVYSRILTSSEILSDYQAGNIEFQTRVGADTSPDDGSWEAWKPTTGETAIDSYDGPYQYNTTDSGLVSYWPMDETADNTCSGGQDTCDKVSTSHGTATGTKIVDGKYSKSRYFNGTSNDYLSIGDISAFDFTGATPFSVEGWIKIANTTSKNQYEIVNKLNYGTNKGWYFAANYNASGPQLLMSLGTDTCYALASAGSVPFNKWTHVAAVVNPGSTIKLYVDGKETTYVTQNSTCTVTSPAGISMDIGRRPDSINALYTFEGNIDELRIHSSALTGATIQQHYIEGTTRPEMLHPATDTTYKLEGSASQKIETGRPLIDGSTVALWHLDETGGTGAYIKDVSANANNGTPTGTTVVNGVSGKGRNFNGSSDFVSIGSTTNLSPTSTVSVEAWIKTTGAVAAIQTIYDRLETADGFSLSLSSAGAPVFAINGGTAQATSSIDVDDSKWHYIVGTYNSAAGGTTEVNIYVDGILRGSADYSTAIDYTPAPRNQIGRLNTGNYFAGKIDEVRISNVARSAEEIAESYRAGRDHYINKTISSTDLSAKTSLPFYVAADRPGSYLSATIGESAFANYQPDANTRGLWHLDEQSGSGAYIKDASGNSNHGTPTGTTFVQGKIGKGRNFNGTSDKIILTNNLIANSSGATIEVWAKPTATISTLGYPVSLEGAYLIAVQTSGIPYAIFDGESGNKATATTDVRNGWHFIAATNDGTTTRIYIDGKLEGSQAETIYNIDSLNRANAIGSQYDGASDFATGIIDEVRISNTARSATEIRQAYEVGLRTHPITIDFGAKLDSGNLITGSGDLGFTVDATYYGLQNKGDMLFKGDKVIVRENYDGTEYIAQGTVDAITASTGATTVSAWDSGSTFPSGGFTVNASVFKWQREYWSVNNEVLDTHLDAITNLTIRLTNGSEGRTIWFDDLRSSGGYLTDPAGSTITSSTGNQFFQFRAINTSWDEAVSPSFSTAVIDYGNQVPSAPTIGTPTPTTTSMQWNFTNNGGGIGEILGFKLFDGSGNEITANVDCSSGTYCTETGLSINTQYIRKVAAYNSYGNGAYSATATTYTLAAAPAQPTTGSPTATTLNITPSYGTNPAGTALAIYLQTGSTCTGSGGNYLAADGSSSGDTPVWQTAATWDTVTATGLNLQANAYLVCVKAQNGDLVATAFGPGNSNNGGWIPSSGNFTVTANMTYANRYVDGNDAARWVAGLDFDPTPQSAVNNSIMTLQSGTLTILQNDTIGAGSFVFTGGSIALPVDGTGQLKPGIPLWVIDADADGYGATTKLYYGDAPTNGRRLNNMTTLAVADCNDNYAAEQIGTTYYQDLDGDTYGNVSATQVACPQPSGYVANSTDCYDADPATTNAELAYPGSSQCLSTTRGDSSYDYNCSSTQTVCGTTRYNLSVYYQYTQDDLGEPCWLLYTHNDIGGVAACGASGYAAGTLHSASVNAECNTNPHRGTYIGASGTQACQ